MKRKPPAPPVEVDRPITPLALCVEDAAEAMSLGRTMVYQLMSEGRLKFIKVGSRTLISVRAIEEFLGAA